MISWLKPGDHLLYRWRSPMSLAIALKTSCLDAVHVEIYDGGGLTMASRPGQGVALYDFKRKDLSYVLRPKEFSIWPARDWFHEEAEGQGYDWLAITRFVCPWMRDLDMTRQICSALAARIDRQAGCQAFAAGVDADTVAPRDFLYSPAFDVMWAKGEMVTCDD